MMIQSSNTNRIAHATAALFIGLSLSMTPIAGSHAMEGDAPRPGATSTGGCDKRKKELQTEINQDKLYLIGAESDATELERKISRQVIGVDDMERKLRKINRRIKKLEKAIGRAQSNLSRLSC